jgi:hypothetical protein
VLLLRQVFEILQQHQFYIKRSMCSFAQPSIEYLGHIVSAAGVATEPSKVEAVLNWCQPTKLVPANSFRYYGPFRVLQRVGEVAYKLDLPATSMFLSWRSRYRRMCKLLKIWLRSAQNQTSLSNLRRFWAIGWFREELTWSNKCW